MQTLYAQEALPESRANANPANKRFCDPCREMRPIGDFLPSALGSQGLMPVCRLHVTEAQAEQRAEWARQELARAGIPHTLRIICTAQRSR